MKLYYKHGILILITLLTVIAAQATTRKVLFIGNSYTYTNNMPLMLQTMATSLGDTLIYQESDPGGYTLQQHSTYAPTITKIFSQQWDIVMLQEQSELPSFPPDQVATDVYPYAHALDSMIHANDTCTQTMFLMTWGHANGDPANCSSYPVICTYAGMQQRLRESYMQMTQDNSAVVAPVGAAWKIVRDSFPSLQLYMADSIHPVVAGSYLEACVLYNSIFHKKTQGCAYTDGLSSGNTAILQRIADRVSIDSIIQWQQYGHYPYAGFSYTQAGNTVSFSGNPTIDADYSWSFGDGVSIVAADAVHTYTVNGDYIVSHTATNDCFSETFDTTIHIITTGINSATGDDVYPIRITQQGGGVIVFTFPGKQVYDMLEVCDMSGKCIKSYRLNGCAISDRFIPGLYIYRVYSADMKQSVYSKFVVY